MRTKLVSIGLALALLVGYSVVTTHLDRQSPDVAISQSDHSLNPLRLFESPAEAQIGDFRGFQKTFTTQTTTGATASSGLMRGIPVAHAIELIVTGGPATCTYRLQGTRDGTTWYNISASDITCTSTTISFESGKPAVSVRGNLVTLTGGTSPTVTLKYVGK
jgi:hypothetical protein